MGQAASDLRIDPNLQAQAWVTLDLGLVDDLVLFQPYQSSRSPLVVLVFIATLGGRSQG